MSVYRYFRRYVEYGVVPAKRAEDCTLVPENSFYKSVHYVDNVLGPVKDVICGAGSKDDYNKYYKNNDKRGLQGRESVFIVCTWCYFSSQHNIATFIFDGSIFVILSSQVIVKNNRGILFKSKYKIIS